MGGESVSAGAAGTAGGVSSGGAGGASAGASGSAGAGGTGAGAELDLFALAANRSVGLEWEAVPGASGYRLSIGEGAAPSGQAIELDASRTTFVHRALSNGTEYQYSLTAVVGDGESNPSTATATPEGEWVLEELGSGSFEDVATGSTVPRVPLEQRIHVLLFADGYLSSDLPIFHDDAGHDGERGNDVDRWVDLVFGIEPYTALREAFVIWLLPRASAAHFGEGDTAFATPTVSSGSLATGAIESNGETAARAWEAIGLLPVQPADFSGGGFGSARTHVAAFLLFDPSRGRAALSGRALALRNPADDSQRIASAFGIGHAHEFTHAFSAVRDEYLEDDNDPPQSWNELSNVVGTSSCGELPWSHLLAGGSINPDQGELVGAFGTDAHGYHSELLCLMNGTHDNAAYYGASGLLRVENRMCNYCRELTAFRVYSRSSVLENGTSGFEQWKTGYRTAFYERFPFAVPAVVPQTNDVQNPAEGATHYDACAMASEEPARQSALVVSSPTVHGCVTEGP